MTKNKEMKKLSIIFVFALIVGLLMTGVPAKAAYNDVTFNSDTLIYISDLGVNLKVVSGSKVVSFVVNAGSIDFNMESGSVVTVRSTDHKTMSATGASLSCGADYSEIGKEALSTVTWTVTPAAGTCTAMQASGGGTPSSGGSSSSSSTTTTTTTPVVTTTPTTVATTATVTATASSPVTIPSLSTSPTISEISDTLNAIIQQIAYVKANPTASNAAALVQDALSKVVMIQQALSGMTGGAGGTSAFSRALAYGSTSDSVKALQNFLKNQGADIYPQGLATGYFGPATKAAIQRFQEKYGIAKPGDVGYGTFGPNTRAKINSLLGY